VSCSPLGELPTWVKSEDVLVVIVLCSEGSLCGSYSSVVVELITFVIYLSIIA
jgi:hypothetical protein